jgi:hypothetical protein
MSISVRELWFKINAVSGKAATQELLSNAGDIDFSSESSEVFKSEDEEEDFFTQLDADECLPEQASLMSEEVGTYDVLLVRIASLSDSGNETDADYRAVVVGRGPVDESLPMSGEVRAAVEKAYLQQNMETSEAPRQTAPRL